MLKQQALVLQLHGCPPCQSPPSSASHPDKAGGVGERAATALDDHIGCIVAGPNAFLNALACNQLRQEAANKCITCSMSDTKAIFHSEVILKGR